jgi:hypothetical protein
MKKMICAVILNVVVAWARAGESEKLAAGAESGFLEARLRFLGPSASSEIRDERGGTKPIVRFWGGWSASRDHGGGAGGMDVEAPVNRAGFSHLGSLSGFLDEEAAHDQGVDEWRKKGKAGILAYGVRQRLFRFGFGTREGEGVFVEPRVGAGAAVISWAWEERTQGDRRVDFREHAAFSPYLEAAIDVHLGQEAAVEIGGRRFPALGRGGHSSTMMTVGVIIPQRSSSWESAGRDARKRER